MERSRPQHANAQQPALLLASANDGREGRYLPSLAREINGVRDVLSGACEDGLCELIVRQGTTRGDLARILANPRDRDRITLAHFAGHATGNHLLFEGRDTPVVATSGGLVQLLTSLSSLEVVFLNGCSTFAHGRRLTQAGIPVVIATSEDISDAQAQRFAVRFYESLGHGSTVQDAFDHAVAFTEGFLSVDRDAAARDIAGASHSTRGCPWQMLVSSSHTDTRQWSLPSSAGDPLFGVPGPSNPGLPQCPFPGLRRFTAKDAGIFFGRGELIRTLYDNVIDEVQPTTVVVYGPTGAGKSSVLEAGLLPRLEGRFGVRRVRLERGHDPTRSLLRALDADVGATVAEAWRTLENDSDRPLVVCVDQLESIVLGDGGHRALEQFVEELAPLLGATNRPRGKLILGLRKEWYAELREVLALHEIRRTEHYVKPLERQEIVQAIRGPTRTHTFRARYRLEIEEGLAERIAAEFQRDPHSAVAPTLQILLARMWEETTPAAGDSEPRRFSSALYEGLRRDGLALGDFVDRQLRVLEAEHSEAYAVGLVHDLLFHHTTSRKTSAAHSIAATLERYPDRAASVRRILDRAEMLYLLQRCPAQDAGKPTMRLAHDTLAPIIRLRYDKSKAPGQVAAKVLATRMHTVEGSAQPPPLDAHDLARVEAGRNGMRAWTAVERELVNASRRRRVVRAGGVGGLAVFAVVMLLMGMQADRRERPASSRREPEDLAWSMIPPRQAAVLDDKGDAQTESTPVQETLAVDTAAPVGSLRAERSDRGLSRCSSETWDTGLESSIGTLAISPDSEHVAVGMRHAQRLLVFAAFAERGAGEPLRLRASPREVAWSPDGSRLVAGEAAHAGHGHLELFVRDGAGSFGDPIACDGHRSRVNAVAFGRHGNMLVSGDSDGVVIQRSGETCERHSETALGDTVYDLSELAGGRWAIGGAHGRVRLWQPGSETLPLDRSLGRAAAHAARVSPDGRNLLSSGYGVFVLHPESGATVASGRHAEVVQTATWLGTKMIVGTTATRVLHWRWGEGKLSQPRELAQAEHAVVSTNGRGELFVGDARGYVRWWRPRDGVLEHYDEMHFMDGPIVALAASPDGSYLVAGGDTGSARIVEFDEDRHRCSTFLDPDSVSR